MNLDLQITFRSITDEIRKIVKDDKAEPSISVSGRFTFNYDRPMDDSKEYKIDWSISLRGKFDIYASASTPEACIDAFRGIALSADVRLKEARRLRQRADELEKHALALGASAADLAKRD